MCQTEGCEVALNITLFTTQDPEPTQPPQQPTANPVDLTRYSLLTLKMELK